MVGKYKVITLCGSTRFKDAFMREQKRLTLEGNIVISVGLFGHSGDEEVWENMGEDAITKTKMMLDDMHKRKIDMADEIFVINENGYIGDSTKSEIAYAKTKGKKVTYLNQDKAKTFPRGLRSEIPGIIDDHCDYCFDPTYTFDKDGNVRITEVSLIRKPPKQK